ncbi:MAG: NYN domain-containing protein [Clostridia bacterium]|nr:NYN domain-containing protein [Clostridia bacterium]
MNKPKMIVLADIASLRVTCNGFKQIVKNLEAKYEIVTCKFYSYVAKRNRDFNEYIAANGYETNLPSASRRRNKLDTRQVMEAVNIANAAKVDAVALITGEGDILPVVDLLKSKGIDCYDVNVYEGKYTYAYTGFIAVPTSALREGYAAPATKPAVKKAPKAIVTPVRENEYVQEAKRITSRNAIFDKYRQAKK